MTRSTLAVLVAATLTGCPAPEPAPEAGPSAKASARAAPPATTATKTASGTIDPRWRTDAETIAAQYLAWGRLDDEARWAPYLCRMPQAAAARFSGSDDPRTHGSKLYTLYAKDPKAYADVPASALGTSGPKLPRYAQVLVKEAWVPERITKRPKGYGRGWGKSGLRPAVKDGVAFGANQRAGLFLMFQLAQGQDQTGTDKGWVYATLKKDGVRRDALRGEVTRWKLTAAGKIASCMECHVDADGKGGRLFGLDPDKKGADD